MHIKNNKLTNIEIEVRHCQTHPSLSHPLRPGQIYQIQLGGDVLVITQST